MRIVTRCIHPNFPAQKWVAEDADARPGTYDDRLIGVGHTEQDAIDDLLMQIDEGWNAR